MFRLALMLIFLGGLSAPCRAGASFPPILDFGHVPWDVVNTRLVTVTLTGRHLDDANPPRLVLIGSRFLASNLRVTLLAQRRTDDILHLTYALTLPEIIGPLQGLLTLEVNSPVRLGALPFTIQGKLVDCPYYPNGTTLMGEVYPRLQVSPTHVDFGHIPAGQGSSVTISLRSPSLMESVPDPALAKSLPFSLPGLISDTSHSSESPWISINDVAGLASSGFVSELWRLRLDPKTPQGVLRTTITFKSSDGQTIVVPVTATVVDTHTLTRHKSD